MWVFLIGLVVSFLIALRRKVKGHGRNIFLLLFSLLDYLLSNFYILSYDVLIACFILHEIIFCVTVHTPSIHRLTVFISLLSLAVSSRLIAMLTYLSLLLGNTPLCG